MVQRAQSITDRILCFVSFVTSTFGQKYEISQISSFLSLKTDKEPAYIPLRFYSAASQAGDADSSRAPGLTSGLHGSVNVHRVALLLVPQ